MTAASPDGSSSGGRITHITYAVPVGVRLVGVIKEWAVVDVVWYAIAGWFLRRHVVARANHWAAVYGRLPLSIVISIIVRELTFSTNPSTP